VLAALAADPGPDNLCSSSRPAGKDTWSSAWLKAFEKHGVFVQTQPVEIGRLPQWIRSAQRRLGLTWSGRAELLAERVEGNLLAAQQEIEKLAC
jgi:DNA polymerase-3 subunit delta